MVQFGYYKVMSNIPKMGQLPTPEKTPKSSWKFLTGHDSWLGSHWPSIKKKALPGCSPAGRPRLGTMLLSQTYGSWEMENGTACQTNFTTRKQETPLHTYDILLFWCKQRMYIIYIYIYIYIFIHIYTYIYIIWCIIWYIYIYIHLYVYFMISIIVYL